MWFPDQQPVALRQPQRPEKRAPGGLQHLRQGAQLAPVELGGEGLHLVRWHHRVLGIAAVELPSHATHDGHDDLAGAKFAARRVGHRTNRLDAQDPREFDAR